MEFKTSDGVTLSVRDEGEGPVVVFVHGWMVDGGVYSALLDTLGPVRAVVPDLRGTGGSDKPEDGYTLDRYAADIVELVDHLNLPSFVLVGHSMGGQIAQGVAAQLGSRVSGLVLINTVPASGMQLPEDAHGLFFNSAGNAEMQGTILDIATTKLSGEAKTALVEAAGAIPQACIQGAYNAWTGGGFSDVLGSITAPTLVLATSDPFLPPPFLQQTVVDPIPSARLVTLPGPGHYPQVETTDEVAAVLDAFIAGVGAS